MRHRIRLLALVVSCLLVHLQMQVSAAQAELQIAGRIVFTSGIVVINRIDGTSVPAVVRENIYVGDVIKTGANGILQIRFIDRAIASLRSDTELHVASYQYADSNSDNVDLYLKQGILRSITGSIQRVNYQFRTDLAALKPAGTDFEVAVVSPFKAYFAVYDGALVVTNILGELILGTGSEFDFGSADNIGPPTGLILQPPVLGAASILQVPPGG